MEPFVAAEHPNGVRVLELREWMDKLDGLSAGFTLRDGGVSEAPWQSLNCALHVGDHPPHVIENRNLVSRAAGFDPESWTCAEQTHGSRIRLVEEKDKGTGRLTQEDAFAETDGLITNVPGLMLTAYYADCVPLYFVDPVHRAVGVAHAGWKGTAAQIAIRMVEAMDRAYGTKPDDLLAAIGPSIGPCCYEVDERVVSQIDASAMRAKENGRYMLDLKEANRQFMIRAGIKPNNIEQSEYCTCCRTDLFFSHRGEGGRTGRMAAWIGWKAR